MCMSCTVLRPVHELKQGVSQRSICGHVFSQYSYLLFVLLQVQATHKTQHGTWKARPLRM